MIGVHISSFEDLLYVNESQRAYFDAAFSFRMTAAAKAVDLHKRGRRAELRGGGGVGGAESLLWVDCPSLYSPPPLLESVIAACYRYY